MPVRPISPSQYPDAWHRVQRHIFDGAADEATKDPSHAFYLPIHQPGTTPQVLASDGSGALDWEALPPVPFEVHLADYAGGTEPSGVPEIALSLTPARALLQRAEKSRIKRATLGLLGSVGPAHYGSPSDADSAIVTALIGAGFTSSEVLTLVLSSPRGRDAVQRKGKHHFLTYWRRTIGNAAAYLATRQGARA